VAPQPKVVYKASNSPFEILQLFFGAHGNNVMQETRESLPYGSCPNELVDLSPREESILAFAIGTLFAIAVRQKRKAGSPFHLTASWARSFRSRV
jgi:hypothetical protein